MKYKLCMFLILIVALTACLRIVSKPVTGDYNPITGVLPNDALENLGYGINIKDLNNSQVIMVISNELYNNSRENGIIFEKEFSSSIVSENAKNISKAEKSPIIERTFDYDYTKKMIPKTTGKSMVSKDIIKNALGDTKNFNALKIGSIEKKMGFIR